MVTNSQFYQTDSVVISVCTLDIYNNTWISDQFGNFYKILEW
jgi:hypothetical protein